MPWYPLGPCPVWKRSCRDQVIKRVLAKVIFRVDFLGSQMSNWEWLLAVIELLTFILRLRSNYSGKDEVEIPVSDLSTSINKEYIKSKRVPWIELWRRASLRDLDNSGRVMPIINISPFYSLSGQWRKISWKMIQRLPQNQLSSIIASTCYAGDGIFARAD